MSESGVGSRKLSPTDSRLTDSSKSEGRWIGSRGPRPATVVGRAVRAARARVRARLGAGRVAIAPGRIELLGNHVDYNGGPVLAAAIDRFIVVAVAKEPGREQTVRAVAADAPDEAMATLDAGALAGWRNASPPPQSLDYLRGLLAGLQAPERSSLRPRLPASIAIAGDVPIGFGVSSSAALCVSLALALADGFSGPEEIVLLAQEAEHRAGTPCGTMDQSASVSGGVIAFDGATLGVERLSPSLGDLVFAVADSGVEAQPEHLLLSSPCRGIAAGTGAGTEAARGSDPASGRDHSGAISTLLIATTPCRSPS